MSVLETISVNRNEVEAFIRVLRSSKQQHDQASDDATRPDYMRGLDAGLAIGDGSMASTLERWLLEHDEREAQSGLEACGLLDEVAS